jgi:hypothetical protein
MKRLMKITLLFLSLLIVGCNLSTPNIGDNLGVTEINFVGLESSNSKSISRPVTTVVLKFFNASDGSYVSDSENILTFNSTTGYWTASMNQAITSPFVANISGAVYIHVMAFDANEEIIYQGTSSSGNAEDFIGKSTDVHAIEGYDIGERGPGGGWVIYDKGTFDATDSKVGSSSWRYIEIAAEDLEADWVTANGIDSDCEIGSDGRVYTKDVNEIPENVILDTTDFYWGNYGGYGTLQPQLDGYGNTVKIDEMASATPQKIKGKGRYKVALASVRRDTTDVLDADLNAGENSYNFSDWFIPSKEDLNNIYKNKNEIPLSKYNLSTTSYWTSSEDVDSTTTKADLGITYAIPDENAANNWGGWSVNFYNPVITSLSVNTTISATEKIILAEAKTYNSILYEAGSTPLNDTIVLADTLVYDSAYKVVRSEIYRIRPARAF